MKKLVIDLDPDPAWTRNPYAWLITEDGNPLILACGHAETVELAFNDGMSKLAILRMKEII